MIDKEYWRKSKFLDSPLHAKVRVYLNLGTRHFNLSVNQDYRTPSGHGSTFCHLSKLGAPIRELPPIWDNVRDVFPNATLHYTKIDNHIVGKRFTPIKNITWAKLYGVVYLGVDSFMKEMI